MSTITVVRPDRQDEPAADRVPLAERRRPTTPMTITLLENGKPNGRRLLELIAEELTASGEVGEVRVFSKPGASAPITHDEATGIAASSDVMIAGLGDCGACSACSIHDVVQLETLGTPSAIVITDPFQGLVAEYARSLGVAAAPVVTVRHPISSRDEAYLRQAAADAADAVRVQLFGGRA